MTALELMKELGVRPGFPKPSDLDSCKAGDPNIEVQKIAVCCIATPDVIRQAADWGAQLLVTHEPTFYDHFDHLDENDPLTQKKQELVQNSGLTIWRFHDCPHSSPDIIQTGLIKALGWQGNYDGKLRFDLQTPSTARILAREIEERLSLGHVRIVGNPDAACKTIALCVGAWDLTPILRDPTFDLILCGEMCEWKDAEYMRDAAQLGWDRALLILGHMGSERDGMKLWAGQIAAAYPALSVRYFDCGEVYTYPESK